MKPLYVVLRFHVQIVSFERVMYKLNSFRSEVHGYTNAQNQKDQLILDQDVWFSYSMNVGLCYFALDSNKHACKSLDVKISIDQFE